MQSASQPSYPRTYRQEPWRIAVQLGLGAFCVFIGAHGFYAMGADGFSYVLATGQKTGIEILATSLFELLTGLWLCLFAVRYRVTLYETAIEVCTGLAPTRRLGRSEIAGRSVGEGKRGSVELWPKEANKKRIVLYQSISSRAVPGSWVDALPDLDAGAQRALYARGQADQSAQSSSGQRPGQRTAGRVGLYPRSAHYQADEFPVMTWLILASCSVIWLYQVSLPPVPAELLIKRFGAQPALILFGVWPWNMDSGVILSSLVTSMFLHADFGHLALNLLFFHVFSVAVEARMGSWRFAVFYLLCGIVGGLTHVALNPVSTIPCIGASGAIAGVLGAHAILLPWDRVRVRGGLVPAWQFTAFWLALQFWTGYSGEGHVAWLAHVGGVTAGLLMAPLFLLRGVPLFASLPPDEAGMDGELHQPWKDDRPTWLPEREVSPAWYVAGALLAMVLIVSAVSLGHAGNEAAARRVAGPRLLRVQNLSELQQAAQRGVPAAQTRLALAYESGDGVSRSNTEALAWFRKAAYQGEGLACYWLGESYATGNGLPKDPRRAYEWLSLGALAGSDEARQGLPALAKLVSAKDKALTESFGREWQAAQQGNAIAQGNIGIMLRDGLGLEANDGEAVQWFEKAADRGVAQAAFNLATVLQLSYDVPQHNVRALKWYLIAEAAGHADSRAAVTEISRYMGPAQISEAEKLASEWKPKKAATPQIAPQI